MKIWKRGKNYYCRFEFAGREIYQSLKTDSKTEAKRRAQVLLEQAHDEKWAHPRSKKCCTLGEILAAYREASIKPSDDTRSNNIYRLLSIVAPGMTEKEAAKLSADVCTDAAIFEYRNRCSTPPPVAKGQPQAAPRPNGSINSDVRKARSLFSKDAMAYYRAKGLTLPDTLPAFQSVRHLAAPNRGYKPIGEKTAVEIDAAIASVKSEDIELWKILSIMRRTGLRNGEVLAMKGDWLEQTQEGPTIAIRNRSDWQPKNDVEANILIDNELAEELSKSGEDDYVIAPKMLPTQRYNLLYRTASKWIRKHIPSRTKSLYELRKEAGCVVATSLGLFAAKTLLRHKSQATTEMFYASSLALPRAITVGGKTE